MKATIIIPYKNANSFLKLAQENFGRFVENYEFIFVNNLSTDGSDVELKSMFPTAIFLDNDVPVSPGVSRNLGIEASTTDKIIFCDIDDFLIKENIENYLDIDVDIVIGQVYRTFLGNENKITRQYIWKENVIKSGNILAPNMYIDTVVHSKIFSKDFLVNSNVRFDVGFYEDKKFLYYLYQLNPSIYCVELPFSHWYIHANSNSATNVRTDFEISNRIEVIDELVQVATGEIKEVIVKNFFNHDIIVYMRDFNKISPESQKCIYQFYKKMKKNNITISTLSKRSTVLYIGSFNFFMFKGIAYILGKL